MKYTTKKILALDFEVSSSEAIMFTKGGKFYEKFTLKETDEEGELINFHAYDEIVISFQIDKVHKTTFDHINDQAKQHRAQWDKINAMEQEREEKLKDAKRPEDFSDAKSRMLGANPSKDTPNV